MTQETVRARRVVAKEWWSPEMKQRLQDAQEKDEDVLVTDFVSETVERFGFCGCGQPEVIVRNMLAYMETAADSYRESGATNFDAWFAEYKQRHAILETDVFWFCAYLADTVGWVEHGGSLAGAWLDGDGSVWLDEARAWAWARERPT